MTSFKLSSAPSLAASASTVPARHPGRGHGAGPPAGDPYGNPRLADLLTPQAYEALVEAHGGDRIYVPARPRPDHPLVRLVGMEGAERMAEAFGASNVSVPSERVRQRAQQARALRAAGATATEIARTLGVSRRHAERLVAGLRRG